MHKNIMLWFIPLALILTACPKGPTNDRSEKDLMLLGLLSTPTCSVGITGGAVTIATVTASGSVQNLVFTPGGSGSYMGTIGVTARAGTTVTINTNASVNLYTGPCPISSMYTGKATEGTDYTVSGNDYTFIKPGQYTYLLIVIGKTPTGTVTATGL